MPNSPSVFSSPLARHRLLSQTFSWRSLRVGNGLSPSVYRSQLVAVDRSPPVGETVALPEEFNRR
jgi:hypothetical protein